MSVFNPNQFLDAEEQKALEQYQRENAAREEHSRLLDLIERTNTLDVDEQRRIAQENLEKQRARREYSRQTEQSLHEESEKRIANIIKNNVYDPNEILRIVATDPVLSITHATDQERLSLVDRIQSEQRSSWDPVNAIQGKRIEDMSPLEELGNTTWSHMKHMAGSLWYKNKKTYNLERLNQLPTKELNHIQKKLNTVNDLQSKIDALSDDLESYDPIKRANAVEQYTYYKNELNKLGLTPEEKITWDRYGDEFSRLNFNAHLADAELEDFADTNVISTSEADRLKQEYALKDTYKRLGETAGYTNPKFAWETIKNNFNLNHIANGLGVIASSALPMIIAPAAGTAMVATSELAEKFADNLQYFYDKHGEIPTAKQFESAVRAAATTAFDLAGTKLLIKDLGKSVFLRDRAKQLTDSYISARALGNVSPKSLAYAVVTRMRMQNMPASTAAVDKAMEKALSGVKEAAKGAPKTLGEKAISSTKAGIKAVNTNLAKVGSDFKSTAKAGASLAFENTGAILSDRLYKDNFDPNDVVDAAVSGLIGGSLFHFISSPIMAGVRIGKDKFDTYRQSNLTRLDTGKEWQKSLAVINDADNREYKSELIEAFSDRYTKLKDQVEKHEESALEAYINRFGEDSITQDKEGNYSFVLPKDSKMTDKEIASANKAIKKLNKVHNNIVSMNEEIDSRLKQLDQLQETTLTSEMEEYSKKETTKERKNKIAEDVYLRSKEEAQQVKMLMAENNITEEHAKDILKSQESGKKSVTDTDFINAVAKYDADDADYYADIAKDSAIKQALVDQDKEAFDKAIDANKELSKARKDYLKDSIFDRAAFNYAGNTENNINNEGFIQTKDDNKRAASYKDLNRTQQKTVLNNLRDLYSGLKDESAPKWTDITASQEAWDNAAKDEEKLKAAIVNEYLSNESPDTVEARLKEDLNKKGITDDQKGITDITRNIKSIFKEHIGFWNLVRGKEIFDSPEAAKEAEEEFKKENPNARISAFTAAYNTINTSVLLTPVESLHLYDTSNGYESVLNKTDATVDEIQDYIENRKNFINSAFGTFKGKGLGEIIAEWTKNRAPKDSSDEKQIKEYRKEFITLLKNIDSILTPLAARKETIKAGKTNKYTQAQQRKAAKREIEAAEKESEIIQEIPNNIKKLTDEDITVDIKNALYSIRNDINIPVDPANPLTQDSLDEAIADWAEQRANANLPITTKDVATLTEYKKKVQSTKSFKNKSAVMNYLNALEYVLRVADMYGHVVRADKRMSSLFGRLNRTGYRWESGEETNKKENELISFYNGIRDIIDEAYYISDTDVPLGNLNTGSKELIYNINIRRKTNELRAFHSKIRGGRDSKRKQEVRKGIQNIFNTLKEYHEGEENGLSLIAKEIESKLTKLEKDILSNPDNLSKYTSRQVGDLFEKMLDSKRFKAFFGLSLANQVVTDESGKPLTNRRTLSDTTSDGVYVSVDSAYTKVHSRASFNKDSIEDGNIRTVYENVEALDKYLNMEGSLFKTFWNKQGKSSVFEDIAREYDIDNITTEQYSGLKTKERDTIIDAINNNTLTFSESIIEKMLKSNSLKEFEKAIETLSEEIKNAFTEEDGTIKQRAVAAMLQYYIANKLGLKDRRSKVLDKEGRLVSDTKFNHLLKQWELAEILKYKHFVRYEGHTPQEYQNADSSQFGTLAEQISQALYEGKVTLKDLFSYAKNPELEAENTLTDEEASIFRSLFEKDGLGDIYAWDTWIEENPELANKLSRFFTQFINKYQISNIVTTNAVLNGNKQEIAGTNKTQHIENDINASAYANDISIGRIEDVSPIATDNFITHAVSNNTDYADIAKLETFLNEVRKIAKYASNFSFTRGNLADEIFATLYEGVTVYNQEVVNTMAAVALNHLTRMAQGQNADWIQKQINTGVFTQKAGLAFSSKNFLSKNNLGEDLGSQILGALNIRSTDKDARAIVIPTLSAALAGRTLAMLQEANLIKIRYFNKDTGAVSDEQQLTGNWMSVVELTQQGRTKSKQMIELNAPRATDKGNKHILNDLLGFNNKDLNFMSPEQYEDNQNKLKKRFNKKHIKTINPSRMYRGKKYTVEFDEKNEIARVDLAEPNDHNRHHYVYLSRHQIVKKDKTLLSYSRLVENAFQNDTPYTVKTRDVVKQLDFLNAIKDINDLNNSKDRDIYYEYLGLEKEDQDGFFSSIQKSKNSAILKSWLDMYRELKTIQEKAKDNTDWDGITELHFPVINTINNRVFFESLGINPREFKPTRIFFTPNARIYKVVEDEKKPGKYKVQTEYIKNNVIPKGRSDRDTMLLKSIICGGLGLDADKATIEDLANAYDVIAEVLNDLNNEGIIDVNDPPTTLSDYLGILQLVNGRLAKREDATYRTVKNEKEELKLKLNAHAVDTLRELLNRTADTFNYALVDNTDIEFDNLNVRVEVDGITNGTGIHFTTSGWIGNQDMYSYQLLAGVGIFPKPYDDGTEATANQSITDFVHAKLFGNIFDSYERLGAQARKETYNKIMDSLARDIQANSNLAIVDLLGQIYDVKTKDISTILDKAFGRNIMKYVLMPNSYGAGKDALVNFLSMEMSRALSKKVYALRKAGNIRAVYALYDRLKALNGNSPLKLMDADGNTIEYTGRDFERDTIFSNYSVLIDLNTELANKFNELIFVPTAQSAAKLTNMAQKHISALTNATETLANVYNSLLEHELITKYADQDLNNITVKQVESITNMIGTQLHIGNDESSLGLLKEVVTSSLGLLTMRTSSLMRRGKGVVITPKDILSRESITSALSPEHNHTIDSDIINRTQAEIREKLGAFLGVHDAMLATYAQLQGDKNAGVEMNKQFLDTQIHNYRPIIEYIKIMQNSLNWVQLRRLNDRYGAYDTKLEASIMESIKQLKGVLLSQVRGRNTFLDAIINTGVPASINQYAMDGIAEYVVTPEIAKDLKKDIADDLSSINMVDLTTLPINGLKEYINTFRGVTSFWDEIKDWFDAKDITSIQQLLDRLNNKSLGANPERVNELIGYINAYLAHARGEYDDSFYKSLIDATTDYFDTNKESAHDVENINSLYENLKTERGRINADTSRPYGERAKEIRDITRQEILNRTISLAYTAIEQGFITNATDLTTFIEVNSYKLGQKLSTDYNAYSVINNLIALTSNINITDLDRLSEALVKAGIEDRETSEDKNKNNRLNLAKFNEGAKSIIIDVDDVSVPDLLAHFNKLSAQEGNDVSSYIQGYIDNYIKALEEQLSTTEATQIVFQMNKAIDKILFSAINKQINTAQKDSLWFGKTIAILPAITNNADGAVDSNVYFKNAIVNKLSPENFSPKNVNYFSIMANNNYKDVTGRNFLYGNIFTNDYIRGNYIARRTEEMPVKFNSLLDVEPEMQEVLHLDTTEGSYIGISNALGYLDPTQFTSAENTTPSYAHISKGDYSDTMYNADRIIKEYSQAYAEGTEALENYIDDQSAVPIISDTTDDETHILQANTDSWEEYIKPDGRLTFGITSSGMVNNSNAYYILKNKPELWAVYNEAKAELARRERYFENGTYKFRDAIYIPIEKEIFINGTKMNVQFLVVRDDKISVAEAKENLVNTAIGDYRGRLFLNWKDGTPAYLKNKFAFNQEELQNMSFANGEISKFLNRVYASNVVSPERTYIKIPDSIANKHDNVMNYKDSYLARINQVAMTKDGKATVYMGLDANRSNIYNNDESVTVSFEETPSTKDNNTALSNKFNNFLSHTLLRRRKESIKSHHYTYDTSGKPDSEMTEAEYAMYRDINCTDIDDISENLNNEDLKYGIDNSHLMPVLSQVKRANMLIRYRLNEEVGRNGEATLARVNGVKVGYVMHGLSKNGEGSNLELFTHELVHIPLDFLHLDSSALNTATQLYNFVAKNITIDDFNTGDKEDKRIYNYLFNNTSADNVVEFLNYALTNARFKEALNNLMARNKVKQEFDSKLDSCINRFFDTLGRKVGDTTSIDINKTVDTIFNKSIDLAKHYYKKYRSVPAEAYEKQSTMLQSANTKLFEGIKKLFSKPKTEIGKAVRAAVEYTSLQNQMFNPNTIKDKKTKEGAYQAHVPEIMPRLTEYLRNQELVKGDLANALAQSLQGVSANNWSYVKMRLAAKELVDKAREKGASAVNNVVREITEKLSTKTTNNLPEYLIHSDMQCLLNGRNADEVINLMADKEARYNEIKKIEATLLKAEKGNYFINSAKGLANKLLYGINTSGIGYNNAYEIANMSGTSYETKDAPLTSQIDQLVTLYTMHELNKQNPSVYKELSKNAEAVKELLNMHSNMVSIERNKVYGDTVQKYHIPKGELHGAKSNNRYEVIPESQLKAYQWVGYKKVKNAKLDSFYSKILPENYVIVEAKFMPDVPYVDGVTVLTDIFKGRNKNGTYIGGKQIESTEIDFNSTVYPSAQSYLNNQINQLNSPSFTQLDYSKLDGVFTPSFGLVTGLKGVDFSLNEKEVNTKLGKQFKITSVLGDHYGSIIERTRAPEWNQKVAEMLDNIYNERKSKQEFTWLTSEETDKDRKELYDLLPYEIKKYFNDKYGDKGIPIENQFITGILGYRQASAAKVDTEYYNKLRHTTTEYIDHLLHSKPVAYGESLARWLAQVGKENIVIKGIVVSVNNIISNCVTLGIQGLKPKEVFDYQSEALTNLKNYNTLREQYEILKYKQDMGMNTVQDNMQIKALKESMHKNPISYLAEHGAIPQIAEDLTEIDRPVKDIVDRYVPKEFQTVAHNVLGDQKSVMYRKLSQLATFGDVTAKYALFKHLTEDVGINKDEALRQSVQAFIDYSNVLPKPIQYLDSIGMLPFTKFLLGNQTNVMNTLVKNPTGATSWIMANSWMNTSDIYGSVLGLDSFTNRLHMPGFGLWYQSLASLPIVRATKFGMDIL